MSSKTHRSSGVETSRSHDLVGSSPSTTLPLVLYYRRAFDGRFLWVLLQKLCIFELIREIINITKKKGYIIPRYTNKNGKYVIDRNAYIEVNIFDIMPGCSVPVQIKCDYCGKIYNLPYNEYYDNIHNHNNCIYCKSCAFKLFRSNENHPLWKPEKTDAERIRQRKCMGYSEFVYSVLERDNYTCIRCGCKSKNMEVHHFMRRLS